MSAGWCWYWESSVGAEYCTAACIVWVVVEDVVVVKKERKGRFIWAIDRDSAKPEDSRL